MDGPLVTIHFLTNRYTVCIAYRFISCFFLKVQIFWQGHKIFRNLHQLFEWQYIGQIIGGDFPKFFGLLRIYELYIDASAGKKRRRRRKRSIEAKMRQKRQIAIVELYEAMFLPENVIRGIHPKGGQLANSQIWLGSSHVFNEFIN